MRKVVCRVSRTTLMARVLDTGAPPAVLASHVATCLRCQAAVAQALRLRRTLSRLALPAPEKPGAGGRPQIGWAAAVASVAAAVLVARSRQHSG